MIVTIANTQKVTTQLIADYFLNSDMKKAPFKGLFYVRDSKH
ncbi:hypothetical protein [Vibrio vulnificus YJ016]|uniref:Uncharacterized protein n=1 Tax=Vibrio vulnificus (strain YJ016) TaxID=196600 RepID=Q7MKX4_VIBVY|nr:hypothetical protein [Vibrio vulnificus YJ016]